MGCSLCKCCDELLSWVGKEMIAAGDRFNKSGIVPYGGLMVVRDYVNGGSYTIMVPGLK